MNENNNNVRVVARFRPLSDDRSTRKCVEYCDDEQTVGIQSKHSKSLRFTFDKVFQPDAEQSEVFEYCKQTALDIMNGFNGCVLVYGQTGSGKTHTMTGPDASAVESSGARGVLPRMIETLFALVEGAAADVEFQFRVSYVEIYMERLRDLLDPQSKPRVREDVGGRGVYLADAAVFSVTCVDDVLAVLRLGLANRAVASTLMNDASSRSHSVFMCEVEQRAASGTRKTGKLYLVDLAGSEKVARTGAAGSTLDEAKTINRSLSALGNVINALTDPSVAHTPYRDSKLTFMLKEALGGNSRTTMIVCCSEADADETETISTLRFGTRAKSIQNKAKINEEKSPAELKTRILHLESQLANANAELAVWRSGEQPSEAVRSNTLNTETAEGKSDGTSPPAMLLAALEAAQDDAKRADATAQRLLDELSERDEQLEEQFELLAALDAARTELDQQLRDARTQLSRVEQERDAAMRTAAEQSALAASLATTHRAPAPPAAASSASSSSSSNASVERAAPGTPPVARSPAAIASVATLAASVPTTSNDSASSIQEPDSSTLAQMLASNQAAAAELTKFKAVTRQTYAEMTRLKNALMLDLEARCARIAELEANQSGAAGGAAASSLAARCRTLQRLADDAGQRASAHEQRAAALQTELDVLQKQLALRNQRIAQLEQAVRQASRGEARRLTEAAARVADTPVADASATSLRVAKIIRGGQRR